MYHQVYAEYRSLFRDYTPLFTNGSQSRDVMGAAFVCAGNISAVKILSVASSQGYLLSMWHHAISCRSLIAVL